MIRYQIKSQKSNYLPFGTTNLDFLLVEEPFLDVKDIAKDCLEDSDLNRGESKLSLILLSLMLFKLSKILSFVFPTCAMSLMHT